MYVMELIMQYSYNTFLVDALKRRVVLHFVCSSGYLNQHPTPQPPSPNPQAPPL